MFTPAKIAPAFPGLLGLPYPAIKPFGVELGFAPTAN
jgi:hypothetical protein